MRTFATKTIALASCVALAGCGPQGADDPTDDAPAADDEDQAAEPEPEPDDEDPGYGGDVPRMPHPSVYGLDLSGSPTLEPDTIYVQANRVKELDPGIEMLEVTRDLDLQDDALDPWARTLTIVGRGPDCGIDGRLLFEQDTRSSAAIVRSDPAMVEAIVADLAGAPRSTCAGEREPGAGAAAPFGPGFWLQTPCNSDSDAELASFVELEVLIDITLAAGTPAWAAACVEHVEPAEIEACEDLVGQISGHLIRAQARMAVVRGALDMLDSITVQAMQVAANNNLGFAGIANPVALADLAAMGLRVVTYKKVADWQAGIVTAHLSEARGLVDFDPVLQATSAPFGLTVLVAMGNVWRADVETLSECYRRVVAWIVGAAGIGFGIRLFFPPNGLALAGGSQFDEGSTELVVGPRRVQSTTFFQPAEIAIHVDQLTSQQQAMTRWEDGPNVHRNIFAGYEWPGFGHTLPADVLGPEPLTLLPIVLAPAGSAIELGAGGYGGPSQDVPDTTYAPGGNVVQLGRVGIDLNWQETDANGTPLIDIWALCKVLPEDLLDPRYCGLGMQTTVPPWQIGQPLHRYWRVWTMAGIVDPENGAVIEPEGAQFFVSLHATAEGPVSECWVWDSSEGEYVFQPWLPGCGPIGPGDGGGGSPGGGGGPGGGPGLPPG